MTITASQSGATAGSEGDLLPFADLTPTMSEIGEQDGHPVLIGAQCRSCGRRSFPKKHICSYCASVDLEAAHIEPNGILYSYTTVHVSSTRPTPYTIGYVDLQDDVRTLALIRDKGTGLRCDMPVNLVVDATGWSFCPTEQPAE